MDNEEFNLRARKQFQKFVTIITNYNIGKREPVFIHSGMFRTRKNRFLRTAWPRQNCTWDLQQSMTRRNASTPRTMQLDFIFLQDQRNADLVEASAVPEDDVSARKSLLQEMDPLDLEGSLLCSTKALEITVLSTAIVDREKFFRSAAPLSDHFGLRTEIELSG